MNKFARLIRKRRLELNILQEDLAKRAGLSRCSIINIEQGEIIPRADKLFRLGMILRIDLKTLARETLGGQRYVA